MIVEHLTLILIGLGFLPWHINRRITVYKRQHQVSWQIYAVFWQVTISRNNIHYTMPVIRQLGAAVWSALSKLVEK